MSSNLGSRLAQLATERKKTQDFEGDREKTRTNKAAANVNAIQLLLTQHITEFNQFADSSLHLALQVLASRIIIKQSGNSPLTLDMTDRSAIIKPTAGAYNSEDYFTIGTAPDGTMTLSNYSIEVAKPLNATQFAELVLTKSLGPTS